MPEYTLTLRFSMDELRSFVGGQRYFICFARGVDSGNSQQFTVIATNTNVTDKVTFKWNDDFSIASTERRFMDGARPMVNTRTSSIAFRSVYTLDPSGHNSSISTDDGLGPGSFAFQNQSDSPVSAVVSTEVNGAQVAFYVSPNATGPGATTVLTPKPVVAVWLSTHPGKGTMMSRIPGLPTMFDFTGKTAITATAKDGGFVEIMS